MRFKVFDREDRTWFGGAAADAGDAQVRALFHEAFSDIDAPDDLAERVMEMARTTGPKTRESLGRRVPLRAAVACAALGVAVVGTVAYAVVSNEGFLQSAFGDKGQQDVAAHEVVEDGGDKSYRLPAKTWENVDFDEAQRLVGDYVEEAGESAELLGYKLTLDQVVVDENGLGVATYTVSNPDGVMFDEVGYGEFQLNSDAAVGDVYVAGADGSLPTDDGRWVGSPYSGAPYCSHAVIDADLTVGTELHAVVYFGPFDGDTPDEGVALLMTEKDSGGLVGVSVSHDPLSTVPATEFVSDEGDFVVSVSPIGAVVRIPGTRVEDPALPSSDGGGTVIPWNVSRFVIHYEDGGEYVVVDGDDVMNTNAGFFYNDGNGSAYLFNRLVDPGAIVSIEVENSAGERLIFKR